MLPETIYSNDALYSFLILYFLEELSDPTIIAELNTSLNPRWAISQYMASWIPYEKNYQKIIEFARGL